MKRKSIFMGLIGISSLSVLSVAACGSGLNQQNNISYASDTPERDNITFATAIPSYWPQYQALKEIVNDWNTNHTNDKNFKKVIFNDATASGESNFNELASSINKNIEAGNVDNIPNIILNNRYESNNLAGLHRLLDLTTDGLNDKSFANQFISNRTQLTNFVTKGIWSIPFTITTNNSIPINKVVLKIVLQYMEKHGANVEHDQASNPKLDELYKETTTISSIQSDVNDPRNWVDNNPNDTSSLNGYTVNDNTFKSVGSLLEFANKAKEALKLTAPIFSIDYLPSLFNQIVYAEDGYSRDAFSLFKPIISSDGLEQGHEYPFLVSGSDAEKKLEASFNFINNFIKNNSIRWTDNQQQWASWDVRQSFTALSMAPGVGTKQSFKSGYNPYTNDGASFNNIMYMDQPTVLNQNDKQGVYNFAETDLIGVHTNQKEDMATKEFVKWMMTGSMSNGEKVVDYLGRESGYVVPTSQVNTQTYLDQTVKNYNAALAKPESQDHNNQEKAGYRAVIQTLENLHDKNAHYFDFVGDQYTDQLLKVVSQTLREVYTDETKTNPTEWNASQFVQKIVDQKSKYDV
ncbi:MAG: hypothetical protein NC236_02330 [Mycoplasma sp.]|nr:hypothetical protein [Mycoplasma sp.]